MSTPKERMIELRRKWRDCERCDLHETRNNVVLGKGNPRGPGLILGMCPGEREDHRGLPMVGAAGQNLDRLLEQSGLSYTSGANVWIDNLVACRSTALGYGGRVVNRDPDDEEIQMCRPRVEQVFRIVDPTFVILLGKLVQTTIFGRNLPRFPFEYKGCTFFADLHPAYYCYVPDRDNSLRDAVNRWSRMGLEWRNLMTYPRPGVPWVFPLEVL